MSSPQNRPSDDLLDGKNRQKRANTKQNRHGKDVSVDPIDQDSFESIGGADYKQILP